MRAHTSVLYYSRIQCLALHPYTRLVSIEALLAFALVQSLSHITKQMRLVLTKVKSEKGNGEGKGVVCNITIGSSSWASNWEAR